MNWYWVRTNSLIKRLFSSYVWDVPGPGNQVYLTFDDGPTPEVTAFVLDQLARFEAKATFFCIGKNVSDHPQLFARILEQGHKVGNHTQEHPNGWTTPLKQYIQGVLDCEAALGENNSSKLFRPPYGKLTRAQLREVKKLGYKVIMWDVLSADFDTSVSPQKCLENVLRNIRPGSIVIFHDSEKAAPNLVYALPATLEFMKKNGLTSAVLP